MRKSTGISIDVLACLASLALVLTSTVCFGAAPLRGPKEEDREGVSELVKKNLELEMRNLYVRMTNELGNWRYEVSGVTNMLGRYERRLDIMSSQFNGFVVRQADRGCYEFLCNSLISQGQQSENVGFG